LKEKNNEEQQGLMEKFTSLFHQNKGHPAALAEEVLDQSVGSSKRLNGNGGVHEINLKEIEVNDNQASVEQELLQGSNDLFSKITNFLHHDKENFEENENKEEKKNLEEKKRRVK